VVATHRDMWSPHTGTTVSAGRLYMGLCNAVHKLGVACVHCLHVVTRKREIQGKHWATWSRLWFWGEVRLCLYMLHVGMAWAPKVAGAAVWYQGLC